MLNMFFKIRKIVFLSLVGLFSIPVLGQETTSDDPFVLVIDPGHGGADAGTLGTRRTKVYEKHVVLDVALRLEKLIKDNMKDVKILMTRRTDVYPTLQSRARLANKNHAHLFLSIHCNAAANSQATGAETLVMATERASANLEISKRENAYIVLEENHQENYKNFNINDPLANIGKSLEQFSTIRSSIVFADLTQKYMCSTGGRKDRHIVQAIIYVTYACTCPAVLVELGFLTNPAEEAFLHSEKGKDAMALALFQAFKDYKARTYDISHPTAEVESSPAPVAESPVPATSDKIEYCVQLTSSAKVLNTHTNVLLRRFSSTTYFKEGTMYKYTTARVTSYAAAQKDLADARKKGAKDAFIIAFKNNEKINVNTARSLTGE
ncbi:MAG: N-acetylmuramoyl-L-alanine amidase [Flavobacteriales bacterium]|jgi:N-acetylmuramoyl-L-alanine amidase|nr:N-acetylmuramoyl-L-alanine amidase [Flavobacteriales bacterium]